MLVEDAVKEKVSADSADYAKARIMPLSRGRSGSFLLWRLSPKRKLDQHNANYLCRQY